MCGRRCFACEPSFFHGRNYVTSRPIPLPQRLGTATGGPKATSTVALDPDIISLLIQCPPSRPAALPSPLSPLLEHPSRLAALEVSAGEIDLNLSGAGRVATCPRTQFFFAHDRTAYSRRPPDGRTYLLSLRHRTPVVVRSLSSSPAAISVDAKRGADSLRHPPLPSPDQRHSPPPLPRGTLDTRLLLFSPRPASTTQVLVRRIASQIVRRSCRSR